MEQTGEHRDSKLSVFRTHPEFTALLILVGFYLFIANFFVWGQAWVDLAFNTSGGSDPYYNYRVIQYILTFHHSLLHDPQLNYPLGANNPRPPFFHWFTVMVAVLIAPAVGGVNLGAYYFFNELDALFGALLIIPVYLITKEVFGKKAGIVAAVLYTLMPSNLSAGILTDGRMHTPELLFAFLAVYFFQKAIKVIPKTRIIENLTDFKSFIPSIRSYIQENRLPTIYGLLSGASLAGLILSWQGYPYIVVIILLYVMVQLVINLVRKVPTGHLTYLTILFVGFGFALGAYPYYAIGPGYFHLWFVSPLYMAVAIIGLSIVFNIFGRRPWIITIPSIAAIVVVALFAISKVNPGVLHEILSGQGYFIKSRVYSTIGEAQSPPLGQYVSGFGAAQFVLGMAGVGYIVYRFFKEKTEVHLFLLVFSVVSIYMSFEAARFNITAAPAYAALGAGILMYFTESTRFTEIRKRRVSTQVSVRKSVKGNINWLHAATSVLIVLVLIIPAGFAMVSAAVPANTASQVNSEIVHSLPPSLRYGNSSMGNQFIQSSYSVVNNSQPLSKSFQWLSTQDSNMPPDQRPAYVSWWDYGFQEMYQGQHPAVADDFQQGYQVAGQVLLAQNQTQIVSLFLSRVIQGDFQHNGNAFTPAVNQTLTQYFGPTEEILLAKIARNPSNYIPWIVHNSSVYGNFISTISSQNAYFALVKGQLSTKYTMSTIVNAYTDLERETGYSIKYIGIDSGQLFPLSGSNTGIFYAPAYLTDTPSYTGTNGQIVPTNYYNIYEQTTNGTFPANKVPAGAQALNYSIVYNPAFYNTSIYRFTVGYPASAAGGTNGIPGVTFGQNRDQIMPAWNMSHFEVTYEGIPWNPYKDYQSHPSAWKLIPLQQAYTYRQESKGTVELFPPATQMVQGGTPIVSYYPGAQITGKITMPNGQPAPGMRVTVFDQYGIPHDTAVTNKNGYYNLTGLPGNDTIAVTSGSMNKLFLIGQNSIADLKVKVSQQQANRIVSGYNSTTGQPDYVINKNYQLGNNSVSGFVRNEFQNSTVQKNVRPFSQPLVKSGTLDLVNSTYGVSYSLTIANGQYSANNVIPLSYQATVKSGGNVYRNISYVNVTNGGSQVNDLFVHYDTMFVNVTGSDGSSLPGYNVTAVSSNGAVTSNVTNRNGEAMIWVPPGSYNVYAHSGNSVSAISHQSFSGWGKNVTMSVSPHVAASVSGRVTGASGSTDVKFMANGYANDSYQATTNAQGYYNTTLPYGTYTAYVTSGNSVAARTFTVGGKANVDLNLQKADYVTLGSTLKKQHLYGGYFQVIGSATLMQLNFSKQKTMSVALPAGSYTFSGIGSYLGTSYSGYRHVYLSANLSTNLSLSSSHQTSLFAYDKSIINGYSTKSAIDSGLVTVYESNIPVAYTEIGKQGFAQLSYPQNNASSYSISYTSPFYSASNQSLGGSSVYMPVTPKTASVGITLSTVAGAPSINGVLHLTGKREYNLTVKNGVTSGNMIPGVYYGTMKSTSLRVVPDNPVFIVTSSGNTYVRPVTQYASVSVKNANSLYLFNSTGGAVKDNSSVPVGIYTLYATNGTSAYTTMINLTRNMSLSPSFSSGIPLNLSNSLSLNGGYYTLESGSMLLNLTKGKWNLPAGSYTVSYHNKYANSTGSYYLQGSKSVSLTSAQNANVTVSSVKSNTGIDGHATYLGSASAYTLVKAINQAGKVVNSTMTNANGYYNMTLPQGQYTIYAVNNASKLAYLRNASIAPFSGYQPYNISMQNGYKTYISVNVLSSALQTNVTITSGTGTMVVNSTQSPIYLPKGNYTFSASKMESETVYNGTTLSVSYSTNYTTAIIKNTYVTVTLTKTKIYSFALNQTSPVATVAPNGSFVSNFTLTNQGNSEVNVTLSSGAPKWAMTFNRTSVDIKPGQKIYFQANVSATGNPPAGINKIPVNVKYDGQSTSGDLKANVTAVPGFSVNQGTSMAIPNGTKIWIPVQLKNTGNKAITVNFSLPQSAKSLISQYNWNATFMVGGQKANSTVLPYNTTETVYIVMTPTSSNAQPLTFNANFNSTSVNHTLKVVSTIPAISSLSPYPGGHGILSNYTGNPFSHLEIGLILIAVIVVAGIIASGMRSRNRGKK